MLLLRLLRQALLVCNLQNIDCKRFANRRLKYRIFHVIQRTPYFH